MPCERCQRRIAVSYLPEHIKWHGRQEYRESIQAALADASNDKDGITVEAREGIDFGVVEFASDDGSQKTTRVVKIVKTDNMSRINLSKISVYTSARGDEHGQRFVCLPSFGSA